MTHTVSTLEISERAFKEIADKLRVAGCGHLFLADGSIDMYGIGLVRGAALAPSDAAGAVQSDWAHKLVQRHANAARALEHMYTEKNIERLKAVGAELESALAAPVAPAAVAPFVITELAAAEWASRHDIEHVLKDFATQRSAIEDASTLHLIDAAPTPTVAADAAVCPGCDGEGTVDGDVGGPCYCQMDAQEGMPTFRASPTKRAAFEAWAKPRGYDLTRCSPVTYAAYKSDVTNAALAGWLGRDRHGN
ncbi:hypothetical protein AB4Y42_34670 [Paraburkholderia sp. EG286B]|uniref:hypothetical protein n=1 Tax=Paraburkholderia sp. EG286B TaxID=3237011 RepID=UPI0034D261D7